MFGSFFFFWQFAMVEVLVTSLLDEFYHTLMRIFKMKELLVLAVCCVALLLGIPCVMQVSCMNSDTNGKCKSVMQRVCVPAPFKEPVSFLGGDLYFPADGPLHCYSVYYVPCIL